MYMKTPAVTAIVALLATAGSAYPHNQAQQDEVVEYLRAKVSLRRAHNAAVLAERQESGGPEPLLNTVAQTSISAATLVPAETFPVTTSVAAETQNSGGPEPLLNTVAQTSISAATLVPAETFPITTSAPEVTTTPAPAATSLNEADPDGGEAEQTYTPPPPPPTSTLNEADPDGGEAPQTASAAAPPAQTSDPTYTEALCGYTQYEFNTATELFTSWGVNLPYNPDWMDPMDKTTIDNDLKGSLGKSSACNSYSAFESWVDQDNLRYEAFWMTSIFCTAYDVTWVLGQTTGNVYGNVPCSPVEAEAEDKPEFPDVPVGESIPEEAPDVVKRGTKAGIIKRSLKTFV